MENIFDKNKASLELDELGDLAGENTAMLHDKSREPPRNNNSDFLTDERSSVCDVEKDSNSSNNRSALKYSKSWNKAWLEFCTETSFHGLKQITEPQPFVLRRIIWLLLVLLGSALFLYQMISGIIYFRSHPVSVNVRINHNDTIIFPAITICNQNAFRQTVAADNGWYDLLSELFLDSRLKEANQTLDLAAYNATHLSLLDIYRETAHIREDMIIECRWDSRPCSQEEFVTTYTDHGVCYTFNSGRDGPVRKARRTGTDGGLQLLLNVEQYEYMMGPNDGAGFRVLVHTQEEFPAVKEFGVAIPPGSHSFLGMTLIRIDNLPKPHGKCDETMRLQYFDTYSTTNCIQEALQTHIQTHCGCRHIDMDDQDNGKFPYCSVQVYFACVLPEVDSFNSNMSRRYCPVSCKLDSHDLFNSIGDISNFDALNLLHSNLTANFQNKFSRAFEVTQRVNKQIVQRDQAMVEHVLEAMASIEQAFDDINTNIQEIGFELDTVSAELAYRVDFHREKGLNKVLYIMEHDFVRGWTILEERTLPFFCINFFELMFSFREVIKRLDDTTGDSALARGQWLAVENRFLERLDVAVRVKDNVTEVHEKYKSGEPVLTYRSSLNRRYDMYWITVAVLQKNVDKTNNNQDEIFELIISMHDNVVDAINTYIDMGQSATRSVEIDQDLLQKTETKFQKSCISYNYNIFRYKTRIVDGPVIVMNNQIEEFDLINRTYHDAVAALRRSIASVKDPIEEIKAGAWNTLHVAMDQASSYLTNLTLTKRQLARLMSSHEMTQTIQDIKHVLDEMRMYGRDLSEKILEMNVAVNNLWTNILTEFSTRNFYKKVNDDFRKFTNNPKIYWKYFADLLNTNISVVQSLDTEELRYMLNADIQEIDISGKLKSNNELFTRLEEKADIRSRIGHKDGHLLDDLSVLRDSLAKFEKDVEIDADFYLTNFLRLDAYMQRLSYEQIIQQPAYELLNLLGDIGGSVGLFLGASAMSLAELLDVLCLQASRLIVR